MHLGNGGVVGGARRLCAGRRGGVLFGADSLCNLGQGLSPETRGPPGQHRRPHVTDALWVLRPASLAVLPLDRRERGWGGVLGFAPRGRRRAALPQGLPLPQAREAEFEAEQERLRREKEREIARLRAMQEKAQDYQAEQVLRPVSLRHSHSLSSSFASL